MQNHTHSHREHLILNLINHLGPISRTELVELTDYRPASVGEIIRGLLERGLIAETGYQSAGQGRKRVLLEIHKDRLCAVGIAFTPDTVICIVARIDGTILHKSVTDILPGEPRQALIRQITEHVRRLLRDFSDREVVGLGICNPPYDPTNYQPARSLIANYTHFNDWIRDGLKPELERYCRFPVQIFSNVTLPALAERHFGAARGAQDFICIELSNGIGASICCGGVPVAGAGGIAGELGHTVVDCSNPTTRLCYCGKPGCVEHTTAYPALAADIQRALDSGVFSVLGSCWQQGRDLTPQDIRQALEKGDQMCMHYVKAAAVRIGVAIANAVNLLNPELIVLYGFMLELGDYFQQQLELSIRENVLTLCRNFAIRTSAALETTMPLGAVAEVFNSYLRADEYKWIYQLRPGEPERGDTI